MFRKVTLSPRLSPPPGVDDDASTASRESRVSPPMVILPLDPHLVDTEMNLAELGNIQTVDSVVEIQYQPKSPTPPPPPPAAAVFDASLMNSAFAKLNEMLDEFRGRRPPLREHVGSDRRSPSAGPSDIARPNPIAKDSDRAQMRPPRAQMRLLDLPRLRMSLLPWVLATMMHPVMTDSFLHVVE